MPPLTGAMGQPQTDSNGQDGEFEDIVGITAWPEGQRKKPEEVQQDLAGEIHLNILSIKSFE